MDPYLLATLVAWDDMYPGEVELLLAKMWDEIEPSDSILMADALRNAIFERCQMVFAARPGSLDGLFVRWVKRRMVDDTIQQQDGDTIYSFSLRDVAPFLYCLLGAQHVARISPKRCDQILALAVSEYDADEDLVRAAGRLYASDKGFGGLRPPGALKESWHLTAWQMGVAEAWVPTMLRGLADACAGAESGAARA